MKYFIFTLFCFYSVFCLGQDLNIYAGLNRNRISRVTYTNSYSPYFRGNASVSAMRSFTGNLGAQLGVSFDQYLSENFFVTGFAQVELRSNLARDWHYLLDEQANVLNLYKPIDRTFYVTPGLLAGISLGVVSFGTGISVPVSLVSFYRTGLGDISYLGKSRKVDGRYYGMSRACLNVPVLLKLKTGEKTFLQFVYYRGITNRYKGDIKGWDNIFMVNFGFKI